MLTHIWFVNELVLILFEAKVCCVSMEYRLKLGKTEAIPYSRDQAQYSVVPLWWEHVHRPLILQATPMALISPIRGTHTSLDWACRASSSVSLYLIFWGTFSRWTWRSPIQLDWLASNLQDSLLSSCVLFNVCSKEVTSVSHSHVETLYWAVSKAISWVRSEHQPRVSTWAVKSSAIFSLHRLNYHPSTRDAL